MATKVQLLSSKRSVRTWVRQDRHQFYGRAQPRRNQSDVSDFLHQCCAQCQISRPKPVAQEHLLWRCPNGPEFEDRSQAHWGLEAASKLAKKSSEVDKKNVKLHSSCLRKSGASVSHLK